MKNSLQSPFFPQSCRNFERSLKKAAVIQGLAVFSPQQSKASSWPYITCWQLPSLPMNFSLRVISTSWLSALIASRGLPFYCTLILCSVHRGVSSCALQLESGVPRVGSGPSFAHAEEIKSKVLDSLGLSVLRQTQKKKRACSSFSAGPGVGRNPIVSGSFNSAES